MRRILLILLVIAFSGACAHAGISPDTKGDCGKVYTHDPGDDICLTCEVNLLTFRVPSINGNIFFDLEVTNCGDVAVPVFAEFYPIIGDPATGTVFDFNINRLVTASLVPDETFVGHYYYHVVDLSALNLRRCSFAIDIGVAVNNWWYSC